MNTLTFTIILLSNLLSALNSSLKEKDLDGAILVANKTASSVSIIFTDSAKAQITIPTGAGPSEIIISPDRKIAVVSHAGYTSSNNFLTLIDLEKYSFSRNLQFGGYASPRGLAFLPDSNKLLLTNQARKSIWLIDLDTDKVVKEILTNQDNPNQITVHPTGRAAYVSNEGSGTVSVIDLNDFTLAGTIHVGPGIEGIDVAPNGREVWVANKLNNRIHVIETVSHRVTHVFESPFFPRGLKFTPDGKNVIVLNAKSGHLTIVDAKTKKDVLYLSPDNFSEILDTKYDYIKRSLNVSALDEKRGYLDSRIDKINAGELAVPEGIGLSPNLDYALISNRNENAVSIMRLTGDEKFTLAAKYDLEHIPAGVTFLPSAVNVTEYDVGSNFDIYWSANRPSAQYFNEMENAQNEEFVKDFETPFLFVLEKDEKEEYTTLTNVGAKKKYIRDYINNKDENPVYPVNYWFLEYHGRVTYAKENYSLRRHPYFDDRGKFYIQYGPPSLKHKDPGGFKRHKFLEEARLLPKPTTIGAKIESAKLPPTVYIKKPNEIWSYNKDNNVNFVVYFAEDGYYRELKNGLAGILETRLSREVAWYWMDLVKEKFFVSSEVNSALNMIERWEREFAGKYGMDDPFDFVDIDINMDNVAGFLMPQAEQLVAVEDAKKVRAIPNVDIRFEESNKINFQLELAQFKSPNKETRVKFVTYTDPDVLDHLSTLEQNQILNLELEYLFRDSSFTEIYRQQSAQKFKNTDNLSSIFLTSEASILPINGDLTIQLTNMDTREVGFRKYPFTVRDFTGGELLISDVLYYTSADQTSVFPKEDINGTIVELYPTREIDRSTPLLVYFEVYNMLLNPNGSPYNVELKLTEDRSKSNVFKKLGSFVTRSRDAVHSMQNRLVASSPDTKELIGFDLTRVKKGDYALTITVTAMWDENITTSVQKRLVLK